MRLSPQNEERRLHVLWKYDVLDTPPESSFDDLTTLAAEICEAPIATITFVDEHRQWFKSRIGVTAVETSRDISFCAHAITSQELLVVPDATKDARFAENPLVVGEPHIRFYAGAPLIDKEGYTLGTICVIDKVPRNLTATQCHALQTLSRHVMALLELRRRTALSESGFNEENAANYRLLFHDNPHPMWVFDQETLQFLEVNEAAIGHYGFSRQEFLSMTIRDIRPSEDVAFHAEYQEKVKSGELTCGLEKPAIWRHRKKDGALIYVEIKWTVIDFGGRRAQLVLANDVTERRQAELQSVAFARLAQDLGSATCAGDAARIIIKVADELLGWDSSSLDLYSAEENRIFPVLNIDLIDGRKVDVNPAYINGPPSPRITEVIKKGGALILRNAARPVAAPELRPFGDANRLSASLLFVPIRKSESVIGVLSIQSYATNAYDEKSLGILQALADQCSGALERIRVEENLANERNLLRTLLDHLPDHIFIKDLESRHLLVNKAYFIFRGLSNPNDLIGHTLFEHLPPEMAKKFHEDDLQVFRSGEPLLNREETVVDTLGNIHWLLTTKFPLRDNDQKIIGLVGISRNITERKRIEGALRETEEMFRLISENVTDLISVVDAQARRLYFSPSYKQIYNDLKDVPGADAFAQIHPEDAQRVRAIFDETLRTGVGRRLEYRLVLPDGKMRHIESQGSYVPGPTPENSKIVLVSRDVSERKRVETRNAALSRLGQDLSAAVSAKDAARVIGETTRELFTWDVFTLNLFSVRDRKFRPILNLDTVDGKKVVVLDVKHGQEPSPLALLIMQNGPQLILKKPPFTMVPGSNPVGDVSRPSASLMYVPIRNRTEVIGVLSVQSYTLDAYTDSDLSALETIAAHCGGALERIRAEEALRSSEVRFHSVWENSVDGMRLTDGNGVMVAVNKSFCKLVEMARQELEGQPFTITYAATENHAELLKKYKQRFKDHSVAQFIERKMTFRCGKTAELEGTNSFVDLEGERPLLLALFRDVTEQKRLETQLRQSQKMDSVGQLAGGIAHDFNNLLTIIQGHASLLLATETQGKAAESLQEIALAAERSANLTRQLLTFSRRQVMQTRTLDLKEIIDEMTKMLRRILGEDILLKVENGANLPLIHADRGMMEQILLNLAINSRDAMPLGGELVISTSAVRTDEIFTRQNPDAYLGEFLCLDVCDTGCGIPRDDLAHIFEPFFTTKEIGKGTGLGLATVYGIVKQHDGWIEVESEVKKGTHFKIFFPRSLETDNAPDPSYQKKAPRGTETILVVEDENSLRELVQFILERQGYHVLEAASGVAALKVWEQNKSSIKLLLTDLVMPEGMTGHELSYRLLADNPDLKVIFTSGYSAETVGKDFVLRDGLNFLQKPYHPDKLAHAVRDCLDGK